MSTKFLSALSGMLASVFEAFSLPQTGVYPSSVNTTGGENSCLSLLMLGIRHGRGVLMRSDVYCLTISFCLTRRVR